MRCGFCNEDIHFFEDIECIKGEFFHKQVLTEKSVRCKRYKNAPKQLVAFENKRKEER